MFVLHRIMASLTFQDRTDIFSHYHILWELLSIELVWSLVMWWRYTLAAKPMLSTLIRFTNIARITKWCNMFSDSGVFLSSEFSIVSRTLNEVLVLEGVKAALGAQPCHRIPCLQCQQLQILFYYFKPNKTTKSLLCKLWKLFLDGCCKLRLLEVYSTSLKSNNLTINVLLLNRAQFLPFS